jgi:phosphoribosylaminoimidazolecarboxamide formyltransferase/IMP cyclohydrolase
MKIKSALISVFNKEGIDQLALALAKNNVTIYSTGGTQTYLENLGLKVLAVEDQTNYPPVFGGRVKTLHPAIFGGILFRRGLESDQKERETHKIPEIDLVVVDLYPFEDTVASGASHEDIIEKIDIGGVSLIRAAAKNHKDVVIVSSKNQYAKVTEHYIANNGETELSFRSELAKEAFQNTTHYDNAIASYFAGDKTMPLRYGENPHQKAEFQGNLDNIFEKLNGKELSYNNLLDVDAAVNLISDVSVAGKSSFAVLKHNNACGCAIRSNVKQAYLDALAADPVSAFGGIFITDSEIDLDTAIEIDKVFYEVCIAPAYSAEAQALLSKKEKRILLKWSPKTETSRQKRSILNGYLIQDRATLNVNEADLTVVTAKKPTLSQVEDLLFADKLVKNTKSNAIILVKDGQLLASGTGQTSRVDALNQAIAKANAFNFSLKDAVLASDAFFPFPDCVEIAGENGISSIIQPGGSIKDGLSTDKANELEISMVHTGIRHFKH